MLGNFTHERAGFALVFLAWSKRYFFLCNEDGWIREKAPNNYEALNMCQTLYIYLTFAQAFAVIVNH